MTSSVSVDAYNPGQGFFKNPRSFSAAGVPNPAHGGVIKPHDGDDWGTRGQTGVKVLAAASGVVVINTENRTGYGNYLVIEHTRPDGTKFRTLYAHMAELSYFKVGDRVQAGEAIGEAGNTGGSRGIHLHFEVIVGGGSTLPRGGTGRLDPAIFTNWGDLPHMVGTDPTTGNIRVAQTTGSVRNGDWTQTVSVYDPTRTQLLDTSSTRTTALDDGGGNTRGWQLSNSYADGTSYAAITDTAGNLIKSTEYASDRTIVNQAGIRVETDLTTGIKTAFFVGGPDAGVPVQADGSFNVPTSSGTINVKLNSDPFAGGTVTANGQAFYFTGGETLSVQGSGLGISGVANGGPVQDRLINATGSVITQPMDTVVPPAFFFGYTLEVLLKSVTLNTWTSDFGGAESTTSPLVLDLNGDGVQTTRLSNSFTEGVHFNLDAAGLSENTGWVDTQDGLLVRDLDADGQITSGRELFGNHALLHNGAQAANGFEALAELDDNNDGVVDANDATFASLKVWKDTNSNGVTDDGELLSLEQAGVNSFTVAYTSSDSTDANGNQHRQQGSFTTTDDSMQSMDDVWFGVDTARTQDTDMLSVSDEIADLPDLATIGNLRSLRQAMVRDDSGQLKTMVQQYEAQALGANRDALLQDILFHWAGVQDVNPASRTARYYGNAIGDARKLAFLEAMLGRGYEGTWCWGERDPNPHGPAAAKLLVLYEQVKTYYGAQLDAQTVCRDDLAAIEITWDAVTQDFVWDTSQVVSRLRTQFDSSPEETVTHLDRLAGVLKSMGSAGAELLRQMQQQGSTQEDDPFGNALRQMGGFQLVFSGTAGNDNLSGNAETNYFYAHAGSDMLSGGEGDDRMFGVSDYDNQMDGLAGDDTLVGGNGNDSISGGEGEDSLSGNAGYGEMLRIKVPRPLTIMETYDSLCKSSKYQDAHILAIGSWRWQKPPLVGGYAHSIKKAWRIDPVAMQFHEIPTTGVICVINEDRN